MDSEGFAIPAGGRSDPSDGVVVGLDLGGTKVLAARVGPQGQVQSEPIRSQTPQGTERDLEDALVDAVRQVAAGHPVRAVGLAAAGFMAPGGVVAFAPHLPWRDAPVAQRLTARLGCPVVVDNDATCAGVAEFRLGAAAHAQSMLLLTVGTGIGGAIGLTSPAGERFVWRGARGMGGEFGHTTVVVDGLPCPCGLRGCAEQYCSGRALERAARRHGSPAAGPEITAHAQAGEPRALAAFAEVGQWLGRTAASACAGLDVELIVVGGGVGAAGDVLVAPARAALAENLVGGAYRPTPRMVTAALGEQAGMIGGALLALDHLG